MSLVEKDQAQIERLSDPLKITFYNGSTEEKGCINLKEENGSFIWASLSIEILLRKKPEDNDLAELIEFIYEKYQNNITEVQKIVDFAVDYSPNRAIEWYTKDSCLYRLLNQALRAKDYSVLPIFQPFIRDMNNQLTDKYQQEEQRQRSYGERIFHVYRGQMMPESELDRIMNAVGQVISMNSFLSTTKREDVALMYIDSNKNGTHESVLFKIEVDVDLKFLKPYADITNLSSFKDEEEVLFPWGTLFRIKSVIRNNQCFTVELQLCDENENLLKDLLMHMKNGVAGETNLIDFAWHLKDIGQYELSEKYYQKMLRLLKSDDLQKPRCYNGLGAIYMAKGDYDTALNYYLKQYELRSELFPSDDSSFAFTYSNLGNVYHCKGDDDTALKYYAKALSIYLVSWGESNHETAACYMNIGSLFFGRKEYENAMFNYKKALNIQESILPNTHRDIGVTCDHIGHLHLAKHELDKASYYFKRSLDIKLQSSSNQRSDGSIKNIYNNMGRIHEHRDEQKLAAEMYEKASKIC